MLWVHGVQASVRRTARKAHLHDGVRALSQILSPGKAQQHGAQSKGLLGGLEVHSAQCRAGVLHLLPQLAQLRPHHLCRKPISVRL